MKYPIGCCLLLLCVPAVLHAGRGFHHHGRVGPPVIDRQDQARKELAQFLEKSLDHRRPELATCVDEAQERGEVVPHKVVANFRLEESGQAHPLGLRMEGGVNSRLQDCLWREISTWRGQLISGAEVEMGLDLRLKTSKKKVATGGEVASVVDRSVGLVSLENSATQFTVASWQEVMGRWSGDLSGCFAQAWATVGYRCEGPMLLPVQVDKDGNVEAGTPRFFDEIDAVPPPAAPPSRVPVSGESEGIAPLPLTPRCPEEVASCLRNSVAIWRLPPSPTGGEMTLQFLVHPPHRLEELAAPPAWVVPPTLP